MADQPTHAVALGEFTGPPFVRFGRQSDDVYAVWVASPPQIDMDALNTAVNAPGASSQGLARAIVHFFGYELSSSEDVLLARYWDADTGPDFWAMVDMAALGYEPPSDLPPISPRTQAMGKRRGFVAIENTVARSPLMLAADLRSGTGRPATASQKAITAVFVKNYAETGCPSDGWVEASFAEITDLFGYEDRGGWQYRHVRDLVRGLKGAGVGGEWLTSDGDATEEWFGIIQSYRVTTRGEGVVRVCLTNELQKRIRTAHFTYLEKRAVRSLNRASQRSDAPMNLWLFLRTQRLPWSSGWPVFRPDDDGEIAVRPVAEILGLFGRNRRKIVQKIRVAARVVMTVFPEYVISVKPTGVPGMYQLYAERRAALPPAPDAPADNSPDAVYEVGTGPCMNRVRGGVRSGYTASDEIPASTHAYEGGPVFVKSVSKSRRATGSPEEAAEQHCAGATFFDPEGTIAAATSPQLVAAVTAAVCEQVKRAAGAATCDDRAPVCRVVFERLHATVAGKIAAGGLRSPAAYLRTMIANAANDPAELIGEEVLMQLRALDRQPAPAAPIFEPKRI